MEIVSFFVGVFFFFLIGSFFYKEDKENQNYLKFIENSNKQDFYSEQCMQQKEKLQHLQSEYWKDLKEARNNVAKGKCEVCKAKEPLELHHVTYEQLRL